jgi:hypothetical protein
VLPTPTFTPSPTATTVPSATPMPTAPPTATPTVTATPTATSRPDPRATATAIASAIALATPAYQLPIHALAYERGDQFKVYPDPKGEEDVGFTVADFDLVVTFVNPDPGPDGVWDYGILFGPNEDGSYDRVYVRSDGVWRVDRGGKTIREGEARRINLGEQESNTLRVIVAGGRGILFLNDRLAGSFELRDRAPTAQLWLATTNVDSERDITFLDLSIWSFT